MNRVSERSRSPGAENWIATDAPSSQSSRGQSVKQETLQLGAGHEPAPQLVELFGLGVDTAAEILIVAGDNPERIKFEAALAKLAGISPIPASSGMNTGQHRINYGGHRQLNAASYRTVIVQMRFHEPTIAYVARRTAEGKSKRDIIRCL